MIETQQIIDKVCRGCITSRTCTMLSGTNRMKKTILDCSIVVDWLLKQNMQVCDKCHQITPSDQMDDVDMGDHSDLWCFKCIEASHEQLPTFPPNLQMMLDDADKHATDVIAQQAREHPDTVEALYANPEVQEVIRHLDAERDAGLKQVDDFVKCQQCGTSADHAGNGRALCDPCTADEMAEHDPRPDLSSTCGQATEYPCPGCCREEECRHPNEGRDSAEVDHDDPINQR